LWIPAPGVPTAFQGEPAQNLWWRQFANAAQAPVRSLATAKG